MCKTDNIEAQRRLYPKMMKRALSPQSPYSLNDLFAKDQYAFLENLKELFNGTTFGEMMILNNFLNEHRGNPYIIVAFLQPNELSAPEKRTFLHRKIAYLASCYTFNQDIDVHEENATFEAYFLLTKKFEPDHLKGAARILDTFKPSGTECSYLKTILEDSPDMIPALIYFCRHAKWQKFDVPLYVLDRIMAGEYNQAKLSPKLKVTVKSLVKKLPEIIENLEEKAKA